MSEYSKAVIYPSGVSLKQQVPWSLGEAGYECVWHQMLAGHCLVMSVASTIVVNKYYPFPYSFWKKLLFLEVILAFSGLQWVIAGQNSS